ncbi:MAG: hypothetical protein KDC91_00205 [Flavobacteriaceae bacterium]|nr:hypothetical protein [Flavobacteriaceae bacterium]
MQKFWNLTFIAMVFLSFIGCETTSRDTHDLSGYIPQNTQTVLKIKNWETTKRDYKNNPLMKQLKDEPFSNFFTDKNSIFQFVKPIGNVLLCKETLKDSSSNFTLITKISPTLFLPDSIANAIHTNIPFEGNTIKKISKDASEVYSVIIDSIFIMCTSEALLKNTLEGKAKNSTLFSKAFKLKNDEELAYIQQLGAIVQNDSTSLTLAPVASFNLQLLPDGIVGNGVVLEDTIPQLLSVFKGQIPQQNDAPAIIPITSNRAQTFTFNNLDLFQKNLQKFTVDSLKINPLFQSINEITEIQIASENVVALKSLDAEITWEDLAKYISEKESFREVPLFSFTDENLLFTPFYPLLKKGSFTTVFQWEDFIVFTQSEATAQTLISAYQSNLVLHNTPHFESAQLQLAQASSLTQYSLQGKRSGLFSALLSAKPSTTKDFPLAIVQLIHDRDFAHLNFICKETTKQTQSTHMVSEVTTIALDREVLGVPKFFTNHNTLGKDIVVQDVSNVLYFISTNGKILWKKQLDGAILGAVNEVDILRNGKKQLAFTTSKTFYILDRNGNAVAPFPKKFKDNITQPLAVFDYDNNRKYRFVICQDKQVLMYDPQGKEVSGFTFKKAASKIILPPQHIRIGNNDYLFFAEENGKLNILSRVGKERITLNKTFAFSNIPIEKEGSDFVVITKDNKKETITQDGKINTQSLQVSSNYHFTISGTVKVTLDDHLLRINGQLVELPLGKYGTPKIFTVNKKIYISVTELKENQVYLYDSSGKPMPSFPVYGTSEVDLADANKNNKVNLLVKGQGKEIILYQAN